MTAEQMEADLRAYVDAVVRQDVDAALALRSPDAYLEAMGLGARFEGHDGLRDYYEAFFASVPDYRLRVDGMTFGDDVACVWGAMQGTVGDQFMGVPAEGGEFDVPVAFVCTFADGRFHGDHVYFDSARLREQAGIQDPAGVAAD